MIDPENEVYTRVATALKAAYPKADISSTYKESPAAFPHVCFEMSDSTVPLRKQSLSSGHEDCVDVTFTANIYSNRRNAPKAEAKAIAAIIADVMYSMNFRRTSQLSVPNMKDAKIYRICAQYVGSTDGKSFYRR